MNSTVVSSNGCPPFGGEGDVDDSDAAAQLACVRQMTRRREHDLGSVVGARVVIRVLLKTRGQSCTAFGGARSSALRYGQEEISGDDGGRQRDAWPARRGYERRQLNAARRTWRHPTTPAPMAAFTAASKIGAAAGALAMAAARAGAAVPPSSERAQMRMTASAPPPIIVNFAPSDMGFLRTNAALSTCESTGIHGAAADVEVAPGEAEIGNILGAAVANRRHLHGRGRRRPFIVADGGDGIFSAAEGIDGDCDAREEIDGVFRAFEGVGGTFRITDGIGGGVA